MDSAIIMECKCKENKIHINIGMEKKYNIIK